MASGAFSSIASKPRFKAITSFTSDLTQAQALLILSRLLFLYFIQQKGWLNGERRFLVDRLEAALQSDHEFYLRSDPSAGAADSVATALSLLHPAKGLAQWRAALSRRSPRSRASKRSRVLPPI